MRTPLKSSRAKLAWARQHIEALNVDVAEWRNELVAKGDHVAIRLVPKPEAGEHDWVGIAQAVPATPDYFGLRIGDVVHNLRSALDHLAWTLADRHNPNRGDDTVTQFPIITKALSFKDWITDTQVKRWTQHMGLADKRAIYGLQPHHTADPPEDHPLARLQSLSNRDKHREIHTTLAAPEFLFMTVDPLRDCEVKDFASISAGFEVGAEVMWMRIIPTGPSPQMQVQPMFTPTIALAERGGSGLAQYVMPNLYRAVLTVIRYFEKVLGRRP